jgi:hypothetical protein
MRGLFRWILACTILCVVAYAFAEEAQGPQQRQLGKPTMKISFVRTGGFAGLRLATTVDSATLSPEEAAQLQALVENAKFFTLPANVRRKTSGADRFQYTITIETPEQQHTVTVEESAASPELLQLLSWLTTAAKTKKP